MHHCNFIGFNNYVMIVLCFYYGENLCRNYKVNYSGVKMPCEQVTYPHMVSNDKIACLLIFYEALRKITEYTKRGK